MPDSPGRELQVDVTCACNARFLATLDPHFISIETPSDRGKMLVGSGRFCTARELMQATSPVGSPAAARRSGLRTNPNASATSSAAETTRATPRTACSSVSCALAAKRPASKAWWWRSHRLRCLLRCPLPVHCLPAAGVLSALGARQWPGSWQGYSGVNVGVGGWVGAASVCGCRAACCRAACWPPGWLLAAGSDRHAVWLSPPPRQPGTETQCF